MTSARERYSQWQNMVMAVADPVERETLSETVYLRIYRGCVIRALESGLKVRALDAEYDLRVADLASLDEEFSKYSEEPAQIQIFLGLSKRALDRQNIRRLFDVIAGHPTPLGKAMRKHVWTDGNLCASEIMERVQKGEILLVDIPRKNERTGVVERHMVHLGIVDGKLVSLSDDNLEIELNGDQYSVFCFTRR